ncbi:MAG TPA: biotin synthase BioB [Nitrospiraceae bacterium]|jgi:biotin synthase|nr:biotin synthase BioB [Nitrospiraceae bacterium]
MIARYAEKVFGGGVISEDDASLLTSIEGIDLIRLFSSASEIRERFRGKRVELCSIINAKSGGCSEDCSYCSQSSKSKAGISVYPLVNADTVIKKAEEAKGAGVKRFCIVTSGRKVSSKELREIASMVKKVRTIGLLPCATLGLLDKDELSLLKDNGLERYHHNLETSERFFAEICSTHTYSEKIRTIEATQSIGLSLCSGGIFGLGESWHDRIALAGALRDLNVDSVPINFLIPVRGTPMENVDPLHPCEALKIISVYRFILPSRQIRVCGGRRQILGGLNSMVFMAGADCLLTGNYLTTTGTPSEDDMRLIQQYGLKVDRGESA